MECAHFVTFTEEIVNRKLHFFAVFFITNNRVLFDFWWKESLINDHKVSSYYEKECLQTLLFFFMGLLTAPTIQKSHIFPVSYLISLKVVQKQTWKFLNNKFWPQWKKSFWRIDGSNFKLKLSERCQSYKTANKVKFKGVGLERVKSK